MSLLFERYDAKALADLLENAGVFNALRAKSFDDFEVSIADTHLAVPHILLHATKDGRVHLLLDACLRRVAAVPDADATCLGPLAAPLDLLFVQWVREEDPTAAFSSDRPALPLQNHPGLGVLRRAFRIASRIASDLQADGVANRPKFFHDALIYQRSRLFLFLDGAEQGRFESLVRDLEMLPLAQASLAVAGWCVRDQSGQPLHWNPGYQVFPLSPRLTEHFHSAEYAAAVDAALEATRFVVDERALGALCAQIGAANER